MISVAALALIAGTGFANAQGTGTSREGTSSGSSVQQSAPSSPSSAPSSATPTNRNEMNRSDTQDKGAAKTTRSEEKMQPGGAKSQRAQDELKAGQKSDKSAQDKSAQDNMKSEKSAQDNIKGEKSKSTSSENEGAKAGKDMKAEGREDRNTAQGRQDRMNAEQKGAAGTQSQTTVTTGQAGAGAKLAPEQRTKITSVIREQHVQPVTNVTFEIRPGVRVPREGVRFYPLPLEVVTIYPQWRGYEYILVNDKILVVDPQTLEIVDVLDV
jgi:hypothetical protein